MKNILIVGADGFVGQAVFKFLSDKHPNTTFQTSRNKKSSNFYLSVDSFRKDLKIISQKIKKIDFIINCIGITDAKSSLKDLNVINGEFPHLLESYANRIGAKLIHISSDAVFPKTSGIVDESFIPHPDTAYGKSKLKGETKLKNSITVRSSFLGLDPIRHKGFVESIKNTKGVFEVGKKQLWSGCTTLQFGQFCDDIIYGNIFNKLRSKSWVFHFTPLNAISKYELALIIIKQFNLKYINLVGTDARRINRNLRTKYLKLINIKKYTSSPKIAILDLFKYYEKNK